MSDFGQTVFDMTVVRALNGLRSRNDTIWAISGNTDHGIYELDQEGDLLCTITTVPLTRIS